jgi:hypothetical protein
MEITGKRIKQFISIACVLFIWWLLRGWIDRVGVWWDKMFWKELPKLIGISTGVFAFLVMTVWLIWQWRRWRIRLEDDLPRPLFGEKTIQSNDRFEEPRSDE